MRLLLALLLLPFSLAAPASNFLNTAIARTVELEGATTSVTTQYNVKSLVDGPGEYWLALSGKGGKEPAWWEVLVGGKAVEGARLLPAASSDGWVPISYGLAADGNRAPTVAVTLGQLKKDEAVTLSLSYTLIHASAPLPAAIEQRDPQYLLWKTNSTYVDSWYPSEVERVKIR
jgi:oligosaccharyltransferase complex subunit alpha (ribophorin I)